MQRVKVRTVARVLCCYSVGVQQAGAIAHAEMTHLWWRRVTCD